MRLLPKLTSTFLVRSMLASVLLLSIGCAPRSTSVAPDRMMKSRSWVQKGVEYLRTGDLEKAEASFATAVELDGSAAALDGLGCVAFRRNNLIVAEKLFLSAIDTDSSYGTAHANLGLLYDAVGKREVARRFFERAVELSPDDAQLRNNFAGFLADGHSNSSRAKMEYRQAQVLGAERIASDNIATMSESRTRRDD